MLEECAKLTVRANSELESDTHSIVVQTLVGSKIELRRILDRRGLEFGLFATEFIPKDTVLCEERLGERWIAATLESLRVNGGSGSDN